MDGAGMWTPTLTIWCQSVHGATGAGYFTDTYTTPKAKLMTLCGLVTWTIESSLFPWAPQQTAPKHKVHRIVKEGQQASIPRYTCDWKWHQAEQLEFILCWVGLIVLYSISSAWSEQMRELPGYASLSRVVASTVRVVRLKGEVRFASGASENLFTLNWIIYFCASRRVSASLLLPSWQALVC